MSMASYGLAEAYVMRDLHKKKLKKEEEEERAKLGTAPSETAAKSSGCFFRPVLKESTSKQSSKVWFSRNCTCWDFGSISLIVVYQLALCS
ncbi:hypothetical protein M0R45_027649 [Rubus argutus]|uniref:Uncharacterized protein n=1 Tax=Rubus argutus TaxID=59490 RepID=A0AAW1X4S7_RUBAR